MTNLLLRIGMQLVLCAAFFVRKFNAWSDRQQKIYEEYQSRALERNLIAWHSILMEQAKTGLSYAMYMHRKEQKAGLK